MAGWHPSLQAAFERENFQEQREKRCCRKSTKQKEVNTTNTPLVTEVNIWQHRAVLQELVYGEKNHWKFKIVNYWSKDLIIDTSLLISCPRYLSERFPVSYPFSWPCMNIFVSPGWVVEFIILFGWFHKCALHKIWQLSLDVDKSTDFEGVLLPFFYNYHWSLRNTDAYVLCWIIFFYTKMCKVTLCLSCLFFNL